MRPKSHKILDIAVSGVGLLLLTTVCFSAVIYTYINIDDTPADHRTREKIVSYLTRKALNLPQVDDNNTMSIVPAGGYKAGLPDILCIQNSRMR